jgi:hypothetical protein
LTVKVVQITLEKARETLELGEGEGTIRSPFSLQKSITSGRVASAHFVSRMLSVGNTLPEEAGGTSLGQSPFGGCGAKSVFPHFRKTELTFRRFDAGLRECSEKLQTLV